MATPVWQGCPILQTDKFSLTLSTSGPDIKVTSSRQANFPRALEAALTWMDPKPIRYLDLTETQVDFSYFLSQRDTLLKKVEHVRLTNTQDSQLTQAINQA